MAAYGQQTRPNVVFILADDLGYGDLSCYGQEKFATPNIDQLAQEGMRFTQCYSGTTVSAPSRSCLLTGMHSGHTYIRGNIELEPEGQFPLPADAHTLFHTFKEATYEAEQENYMCFYNAGTSIIKMFYFYEPNSHYEGFDKVLTCIKDGKVIFADHAIESDGILLFPNKLSSTEEQVYCGWNGFIYQVPQQDANADPHTSILIANN